VRACTLASIIRSEYVRLARHDTRTTGRIPQLTRGMRQLKREVSLIKPHVGTKSQRPQEVGKRRPKLHLYATNVRELDTSRECPTRINREANSTNSPRNWNPSELSKRSRSSGENSTIITEGSAKRKPRVRETRERCKGRQLLSPQRP